MTIKIHVRLLAVMLPLLLAASAASAQSAYPDKPVRIIVPYAPGGTSDFIARLTAQKLSEQTGKSFVVENKAGASGRIGYDAVAKAPGDGYTLVASDTSYAMLPGLYPKLPWDANADLRSITVTAETPVVITVHPDTNFKTLAELITYAKANPGKLNYGSGGAGSSTHLAGELLKSTAGIDLTHIPFKGAGDAVTGLISGQVQVLITAPPTVIGHIKSGKAVALAVSAGQRSAALPQVPTTADADLPTYKFTNWFGLMAPASTPDAVVNYVQMQVAKILTLPDVIDRLASQGAEPVGSLSGAATVELKADTLRWSDVINKAGIVLE
jgi:tripartite-type tricarboxylate transporter receptor subunit TctC